MRGTKQLFGVKLTQEELRDGLREKTIQLLPAELNEKEVLVIKFQIHEQSNNVGPLAVLAGEWNTKESIISQDGSKIACIFSSTENKFEEMGDHGKLCDHPLGDVLRDDKALTRLITQLDKITVDDFASETQGTILYNAHSESKVDHGFLAHYVNKLRSMAASRQGLTYTPCKHFDLGNREKAQEVLDKAREYLKQKVEAKTGEKIGDRKLNNWVKGKDVKLELVSANPSEERFEIKNRESLIGESQESDFGSAGVINRVISVLFEIDYMVMSE